MTAMKNAQTATDVGASPATTDDPLFERLVLRDGSVAALRLTEAKDRDAMRRFFHELSPASRYKRFFTPGEPANALVDRFCDSRDSTRGLTLVAVRTVEGEARFVAVGSYLRVTTSTAEAAFAVDDRFHGKGLATLLLERLAVLAAAAGFERFQATTLADNRAMLEVFSDSGFQIRSTLEGGCIEVQLSLEPSATSVAAAEERERTATVASLRPLLEPRAVAVIGASRDEASLGRRILHAIIDGGFGGPIYPVNPKVADMDGLTVYPTVRDLPAGVDLAVVAVPPDAVAGVADECVAVGVKSLVVITAGFAEAGEEGRVRQRELVEKVRSGGMRLIGPNCMGLLNATPQVRLNASFSPMFPASGRIGLLSQSGALGIAILELAGERGIGLSTFVSAGNKADVSGNDLLEYWQQDPSTEVILLYLESFGNPRRFARLARRIGRHKPIVAVKAGRTRAGHRAASSHTAALAANDVAVDALFHQAGVIRADTIDEMFDVAMCLEAQPLPPGRRVAMVTNSGGPGILAVDACLGAGLTVADFSAATQERLAAFLPAAASLTNPVDMVASAGPSEYRRAIQVALTSDDTDAVLVIYTAIDSRQSPAILSAIRDGIAAGRAAGATKKPVLACLVAEPGRPQPLAVGQERIPAYAFPENAVRALGKVAAYADWRHQPPGLFWRFDDIHAEETRALCREIVGARGDDWLTSEEIRRVLNGFGLQLAPGVIAHKAEDAAALAAVLGFPVVAKLSGPGLLHKTELGAVRLNLANEQAVRRAFNELMAMVRERGLGHSIDGVLIQPMVSGVETMFGITQDPLFGPLVAFGLGGVDVEILGDVHFRIAPLTDRDAHELLHGIRAFPLLTGYRGRPAADVDALREILLRVSRLAEEVPEILEVDLNPVIALAPGHGCRIVDARVKVGRRPRPGGQASVSDRPAAVSVEA